MTSVGARSVKAAAALKPLGLTLLVSPPDRFVVTDQPDKPETGRLFTSIEQVEAFIAEYQASARGGALPAARRPRVGDPVHYVSYGTPGGEYKSECRAAIVTEVPEGVEDPRTLGLCVLNPTGMFFNRTVPYGDGTGHQGDPECLSRVNHGQPFDYCGTCGWTRARPQAGTWHWPGDC